jgi:hypothetical protein
MIIMKTVRSGKIGLKVSRIGMSGIPLTHPTEDESKKLEIREILAMPLKKALMVERARLKRIVKRTTLKSIIKLGRIKNEAL